MRYDAERLPARIEAVKLVRVEVKRKSVDRAEVKPSQTVKPNLWPRLTLECEGKTRTVSMMEGIGNPISVHELTARLSREILKMAAGRKVLVSGPTRATLYRVATNMRMRVMKKIRATSLKKSVTDKVQKEVRAHRRADMLMELARVMNKAHGILNKRDVVQAWEDAHKARTVMGVMEA